MKRLWFEEKRVKKGLSLQELANLTGVTRTYIYYIENGKKTPRPPIAYKIAEILKVNPMKFYEIKKEIKTACKQ